MNAQAANAQSQSQSNQVEQALKRAKQSGTLSLQGRSLKVFPADICRFQELNLTENWWDSFELTKIDISNNEIESIPEEIGQQEVSFF